MGKIIRIQFRRSRLPRRLLNDGWWLETPPTTPSVIAFPKPGPLKPGPRFAISASSRQGNDPMSIATAKARFRSWRLARYFANKSRLDLPDDGSKG
jgi:hypothetical protein